MGFGRVTSQRGELPDRGELGAIAAPLAGMVIIMSILAVGAISVGRIAAVRSDAQQAADSAALAAAQIIRERGLPFDNNARTAAEAIAQRNSQLPIAFQWNVTENATAVSVGVVANINVDMPRLIFSSGSTAVSADGVGQVSQSRFDDAERRLPKLVLALDYSGSMNSPFSGGGSRAIDVLENSVATLLNANLMIDYGAAFYSSSVFRAVSINNNAPSQIVSIMNSYGAGGSTNTAAALNRSRNLLTAQPNTGYYVLLVSDGEPCCGGGAFSAARAAAQNLWNSDVTIFTLEIRRSGSSSRLSQFMTDVAGTPARRGDPNYHFVATTAADLLNEFKNIVASIVCKVGPVTPAPGDPSSVRVFLSSGGTERAVPTTTDLAANNTIEAFQYNAGDQTIRLTERACDAVIDNGDEIVVRYDRPSLTE